MLDKNLYLIAFNVWIVLSKPRNCFVWLRISNYLSRRTDDNWVHNVLIATWNRVFFESTKNHLRIWVNHNSEILVYVFFSWLNFDSFLGLRTWRWINLYVKLEILYYSLTAASWNCSGNFDCKKTEVGCIIGLPRNIFGHFIKHDKWSIKSS